MSGFSAHWLRLREPYDGRARALAEPGVGLQDLGARLRARQPGDARLTVIDLACGTGANLRALAPRLGGLQRWHLVDHDPVLLDALPGELLEWSRQHGLRLLDDGETLQVQGPHYQVEVYTSSMDLAAGLGSLPLAGTALVTASALLDLVSAPWLQTVAARCAAAGVAALFTLSVDGELRWSPPDADDARIGAWFAADQQRDKGFGIALGAAAADLAAQAFASHGMQVTRAASPWVVSDDAEMVGAMIEGLAAAALQQAPQDHDAIGAWRQRRLALAAHTHLQVGHVDLLAWPSQPPPA